MIHTRIDPNLKHKAELVFSALGINTTEAIRMFLTQVTLKQGLPFEVRIPNKETIKAMEELRTNKNLKSYSTEEFHELLNAQ
ncbi:MAG: type II toxin-antitoxin system RelB/DinJ family antitoxin [Verrucomicrobia bacterium]|nr:type II toxin-antitoxin system RelB/DinJ family antitoxin [Verrucomicrobiota bacterium]